MDMRLSRRAVIGGAAAFGVFAATPVLDAGADGKDDRRGDDRRKDDRYGKDRGSQWRRWAKDTWRSIEAMTDEDTGLVADNIDASLSVRSGYTSPTNIGGFLWSCLLARDLGFIRRDRASAMIRRTLSTLGDMERHDASGMYYNWYDEATGAVLRTWPDDGATVYPFASSVDMGWLGAALHVVAEADDRNSRAARRLAEGLRWDMFYDPAFGPAAPDGQTGGIYGGFWTEDPGRPDATLLPPTIGRGPEVWYTTSHHYDTTISEARMVSYLGIARRQIPGKVYYGTYRTFPPEFDWQEMPPVGEWTTVGGVRVFQGAYTYRGFRVVPGWGGSMFEELMPDLFVPEARWAPRSWGRNHPLHVRAQREHGLDDARYGYWGFSPCSNPAGGYREYGVDALGLNPEGYFSDQEMTNFRHDDPPTTYGDGVVTPHASFLALMYEPEQATRNLRNLARDFDAYGRGGFYDAIAVRSGTVAKRYLSLDQSMSLGALGNVLLKDRLRRWFGTRRVERALRPVISAEEFNAGT